MRAQEFVKPHQMAKLEKTGRIVEILRHQDQVDFSDEPGWYLINLEPGKRVAPDMKWIPDSTRFEWVREFKRADAVVEDITPNTIHKLADRTGVKWDNEPSFLQLTKRLTGKEHLDDLNQTELHKVKQHLEKQGVAENFADGKGPGRPGDSARHGIPKGATIAQLEKAAKAPGRKGQLARWQLNMRRGQKK